MATKQNRAIVIVTKKPIWKYLLFMKRFSKGWDVFFNPSDSTKKLIDLSYQDVTFYYDTSSKFVVAPNTWRMIKLEGNPLKSRTYQEAWAHLTYDVYKELGHNDEQGYVAR